MSESALHRALKLALALFPAGTADPGDIVRNCDDVLAMLAQRKEELPDRGVLIKEVESRIIVLQERSTGLDDTSGHEEWLSEQRNAIDWHFWDRYRRYLEQEQLLPPAVISRLDESTDRVLGRLEYPLRPPPWDRRGMVVGQVQSGKTGHYTALACKAADAGYKLIIVLAGMHNSLRSQTQLRLDEGLLGFDTQYQFRYDQETGSLIGVGAMPGAASLKMGSLTTSKDDGDFKAAKARSLALPIGEMPVLVVVKKNGSILRNLVRWVTQMHGVGDTPMLLIDDEADNASINTKAAGEDPTVINRRIRELLNAFDKSAYVGYTATPFANIFTSTSVDDAFGRDLFPEHFIESLKPPSNYLGPSRVFGLMPEDGEEDVSPLPILRAVTDHEDWIPDKHKKTWSPDDLHFPESLRTAILLFLLTCAARRCRGQQDQHNSMLVHTTRFQDVQKKVAEQVDDFLTTTRYRMRYGDGSGRSIWDELSSLWRDDFVPTSSTWDGDVSPVDWSHMRDELLPAVDKIEIRTINGSSQDALEYYEHRNKGLSVIAIGGDKLSRGLTLDGLSISYYLRATRMYDTLMQMGRWFGYRPGYEDLCRLYTTPLLFDWYREITAAAEELRADFDDMAARKASPEDYGLRVRQSPAGLRVTSPSKMRAATEVKLTFSGDITESVTFDCDITTLRENRQNLETFVTTLIRDYGEPKNAAAGNYVWTSVSGELVAESFFQGYRAERKATKARPELIAHYIRESMRVNELSHWTIAIVNNQQSQREPDVVANELNVGLTYRESLNGPEDVAQSRRYTIRRILNPADETIGLTSEQKAAALNALTLWLKREAELRGTTFKQPQYPRGTTLREQRDPVTGALLLIYMIDNFNLTERRTIVEEPMVGFAVSFPVSQRRVTTTYQVNEIWRLLAFDEFEDDDDGQ